MAVGSYRVLGEILQYIMSHMWLDFIQNTLAGDTSIANWIAHGGVCVGSHAVSLACHDDGSAFRGHDLLWCRCVYPSGRKRDW